MENRDDNNRENFQSFNFSPFYHHLKVNFHLFHWLNLLSYILLSGSCSCNMAVLDYEKMLFAKSEQWLYYSKSVMPRKKRKSRPTKHTFLLITCRLQMLIHLVSNKANMRRYFYTADHTANPVTGPEN